MGEKKLKSVVLIYVAIIWHNKKLATIVFQTDCHLFKQQQQQAVVSVGHGWGKTKWIEFSKFILYAT